MKLKHQTLKLNQPVPGARAAILSNSLVGDTLVVQIENLSFHIKISDILELISKQSEEANNVTPIDSAK